MTFNHFYRGKHLKMLHLKISQDVAYKQTQRVTEHASLTRFRKSGVSPEHLCSDTLREKGRHTHSNGRLLAWILLDSNKRCKVAVHRGLTSLDIETACGH